jgi:hypothetical protein
MPRNAPGIATAPPPLGVEAMKLKVSALLPR